MIRATETGTVRGVRIRIQASPTGRLHALCRQ
jgi:hypothetical protein